METMKLGLQARHLTIKSEEVDEESRTLELSFSSEEPFERYYGIEVLSHKSDHVDLDFMGSGNAPLLAGHDHYDQIGVIEKAWLQDGVGRARVRFGKSGRANEIFEDVKDGIRKNVSVGYHVNEMVLKEKSDKGLDTYLVTRWTPVEASFVAVPADTTVGMREGMDEVETVVIDETKKTEVIVMSEENKKEEKQEPKVDMNAVREAEMNRQADLLAIGEMSDMKDEAKQAVRNQVSVDDFRAAAFDKFIEKAKSTPAVDLDSFSDKDKKDMNDFSFVKAFREAGENKLTGVEKEMHEEGVKESRDFGRAVVGNLSIPYQVLVQRDVTVDTDDQGGYTVATNLQSGSFIELLQNKIAVKGMGATVLDNLVGDIAIPSQATGATAAWEGENDAGAESSPTFGQVALAPNRVGTYVDISNKLIVQSSLAVENVIRNLIADSIAQAMDLAALHGTGSNDQPTGIAATGSIGSVAGGTNGLAPTFAHMIELETDVAVANADVGRMGYLTNAKVRGKLKGTQRATSTGQWVWDGTTVNGYHAEVSNQVSAALTKGSSSGVCSAVFFGNWADLYLAFWGGMSFVVDPYTLAKTNVTSIIANTYADVGVGHAASFSAMLDALTT